MPLVGLDLTEQGNIPAEAQVGYRNEVNPFRLAAIDIQAAKDTAKVAGIKDVDDIASAGNG